MWADLPGSGDALGLPTTTTARHAARSIRPDGEHDNPDDSAECGGDIRDASGDANRQVDRSQCRELQSRAG
jgi:hypothetical protein